MTYKAAGGSGRPCMGDTVRYLPTIFYTDVSGIKAMWKHHQILISPEYFSTKERAQGWVDSVKKYWLTPKMAKKVLFESSGISEVR